MADKKSDVENFLKDFKQKLKVFDVVLIRTDKNSQTLLDLGITYTDLKTCLSNLEVENFYKGPEEDRYDQNNPEVWEFGMQLKSEEIYIKISMGKENNKVICKSFHIAERSIKYPFKQK